MSTASDFAQPGLEMPHESRRSSAKWLWSAMPSWLISTVVHVGVLLVLGAWNIEPITKELKLMLSASESTSTDEGLEEFAIDDAMSAELTATENKESVAEAAKLEPTISDTAVAMNVNDLLSGEIPLMAMTNSTESLVPKAGIASQASAMMRVAMAGRSKEAKRDLLNKFGGSNDTEQAVSRALKWLAMHQDQKSGGWTLAHSLICNGQCDHPGNRQYSNNAATGMALMCFLGAGQTHIEGEYKETVMKGLSFLIKRMKFQKGYGSWYVGDGGKGLDDMYAHGIASIAMCEAFGMTRDPALLEPAQAGIDFLTYAQHPSTGGWHYGPQGQGDTSIVGWQMMAIKSAAMSGLAINVEVVRKANRFLDAMSWGENNAFYHYDFRRVREQAKYKASTTACGVLCRMYSGIPKDHPSIQVAIDRFAKDGPSPTDTYYNYYATQVMKQAGGAAWDGWNSKMKDLLVASQVKEGHASGSWFWKDAHIDVAGRFYTTCMATMMLEVYYRYLPLYSEQSAEDSFKL
jgi:hypothetical protein